MNLREELDRSIGPGPPLPAAEERLRAGRVALRRRRLVVGAAGAAVLIVTITPLALSGGPTTGAAEPAPVGPPAPQQTVAAPPMTVERWPSWVKESAYIDVRTGALHIRPDARVVERRDDLYPTEETFSVALDLVVDGEHEWLVLESGDSGGMGVFGGPGDSLYDDFDDFVAKATAGGGSRSGPGRRGKGQGGDGQGAEDFPTPGEVTGLTVEGERFSSDGTVTILAQQPSPDLPDSFAPAGDATAAAYVEQDGVRSLVLSRPGPLIVVESAGHGDSLAALVDWARGRYQSREGLL